MTFEEIPSRMRALGVDREWLMRECRYSKSTLASTLAPKGTNRNERALKTIWEALDREEDRQKTPAIPEPLRQPLILEPTPVQFDRWTSAFKHSPYPTFSEWAKAGLDAMAEEEFRLRVADEPNPSATTARKSVRYPRGK